MSRLNLRPERWGLRARLLVPLLVITLGAAGAVGVMEGSSAQGQAEEAISGQGSSALDGIVQRLQEMQRSDEVLAQVLAQLRGVQTAIEAGDRASLARELGPLLAGLNPGSIAVYDAGQELLYSSSAETVPGATSLIGPALTGRTYSVSEVGEGGPGALAVAPIKSGQAAVGVLAVGTTMSGESLSALKGLEGIELASFRDGSLVSATTDDPELLQVLKEFGISSYRPERADLAPYGFDFRVQSRVLGEGELLVALVPTADLEQATSQHNTWLLVAISALAIAILAMILINVLLARDIEAPLEDMSRAVNSLVVGDYGHGVASSKIREVNELSGAFNHLLTQLEIRQGELEQKAFHDPLTGLPNRALFTNRLEHALASVARRRGRVAVMFVDLDDFKSVNDTYGHSTGDSLLVEVARRLQLSVREVDTISRFGGDEFTVLVENAAEDTPVVRLAGRVKDLFDVPFVIGGHSVSVTTSIGIAFSAPWHTSPDSLLREADAAMYQAKLEGKGSYKVFAVPVC